MADVQAGTATIPDEETRQILAEMEKDKPTEPPVEEDKKAETPPEPPKKEVQADDEDTSDDEEVKEREQEEDRAINSVPYARFAREREKRRELEAQLQSKAAELQQQVVADSPQAGQTATDFSAFAEKYGLDASFAQDLVSIASKNIPKTETLSKEDREAIDAVRQQRFWQQEYSKFDRSVDELKETFPDEADTIEATRGDLKKFAFMKGYHNIPLYKLYFSTVKQTVTKKKTAESSVKSVPSQSASSIDFENVSSADINAMTAKEFEQYSELMAKKSKSLVTRH